MKRAAAVVLVFVAACSEPPQPTAIQRGEALFEPCARKLATSIVADLKKSSPAGYDLYLKESGGKDEAGLVDKVAKETLKNYAEALSVSSAKESDLKAGRFDDPMNERKVKAAMEVFAQPKVGIAHVCKAMKDQRAAGQWQAGLDLEFAARLFAAESASVSASQKR